MDHCSSYGVFWVPEKDISTRVWSLHAGFPICKNIPTGQNEFCSQSWSETNGNIDVFGQNLDKISSLHLFVVVAKTRNRITFSGSILNSPSPSPRLKKKGTCLQAFHSFPISIPERNCWLIGNGTSVNREILRHVYFQTDGRRWLTWPALNVDCILCQGLAQPRALLKNASKDYFLGGVPVISSASGYQMLLAKLAMLHGAWLTGIGKESCKQLSYRDILKSFGTSNKLWMRHSILWHSNAISSLTPFCMNLLSCRLFL